MGKVLSIATKYVRDFNVESRAHKIISKEKPTPAPKYKADILELERIQKEHPEIIEESMKKDDKLDKRLKDVFVKSQDPPGLQKPPPNPSRPLPLSRTYSGDFEYGFQEPINLPKGKTTLKNALLFINNHQSNPKVHTSSAISQEHNIPEEIVKNILKYYKVFEMYVPEKGKPQTTFFGPRVPRTELVTKETKALPADSQSSETSKIKDT